MRGHHPNSEGLNGTKPWRKREFALCLSRDILLLPLDISTAGSQAFEFGPELHRWLFWVSGLLMVGCGTSQLL